MKQEINIPTPSKKEVKKYLKRWEEKQELQKYRMQEKSLCKLFAMFPNNNKIEDILSKVCLLNDFYSTNIYSVYEIAEHISNLNIDEDLQKHDKALVEKIAKVKRNGKIINNYVFATKYCSHHNPLNYPIYDD